MTRTLFVTNDFPPRRGGIETFVRQLCEALPAEQVVVHTASMPGDTAYDRSLSFPVVRDPAARLLPSPAVGERVVATVRAYDCDRVVFGAAAPLGLLAPRLREVGVDHLTAVSHGHEVWWASVPVTRRLLRRIGDSVDEMTYVSEYCRERIAPALSEEAADRMTRLSPVVDASRYRPGCGGEAVRERHDIARDALVAVTVGRLVRRKGQDTLVRVWPEVRRRHPGAVLLLVGDGPQRARLERMVARRGLGSAVLFTGSVAWEDVPAHLDAADVFAMPCRDRLLGLEVEAFGIVYLEAAAAGLPIVGGRSGGSSEAVAAGKMSDPRHRAGVSSTVWSGSAAAAADVRHSGLDGAAGVLEEDLADHAAESEGDHSDEGGDGGDEQPVLDRAGAVLPASL